MTAPSNRYPEGRDWHRIYGYAETVDTTDKAICLTLPGEKRDVWIPLSAYHETLGPDSAIPQQFVRGWIVRQKGIDVWK